jgi:methyltransferase, FkbM family
VEEHLRALLDILRIDCVLDVGAHVGSYGLTLRNLGYTGRLVSFEPVAANVEELRRRADRDWVVVQKAVGKESGRRSIKLTGGSMQHSFLSPSAYGRSLAPLVFETVGEEVVDVVRLDDVFADFVSPGERVFLKIDTQGLDLDVLMGAESSLSSIAALQFELALRHTYEDQPDYLAVLAWLRQRGFEPTGIFPFLSDRDLFVVEAECVCRRTTTTGGRG